MEEGWVSGREEESKEEVRFLIDKTVPGRGGLSSVKVSGGLLRTAAPYSQ